MTVETLVEYVAIGRGRIDKAGGVIRGVKILGLESRNGRSYPLSVVQAARGLYENAKVHIDHPAQLDRPRDYQSKIGILKNVKVDAGLSGNLCFNPKHALAEQLIWDAENAPDSLGLSHNIMAVTRRENGKTVVEEITAVVSVDIVSDPATTGGLFEGTGTDLAGALARENAELRERFGGLDGSGMMDTPDVIAAVTQVANPVQFGIDSLMNDQKRRARARAVAAASERPPLDAAAQTDTVRKAIT